MSLPVPSDLLGDDESSELGGGAGIDGAGGDGEELRSPLPGASSEEVGGWSCTGDAGLNRARRVAVQLGCGTVTTGGWGRLWCEKV